MKITPGKKKGLKAVSNERGVIAAAAMDQRGSLKSAIAKDKGIDKKAVTPEMMREFKEAVTRILTPYASAILLDPEYGLKAAKERAKNAGLLLAYENSGYDNTQPGRCRTCWTIGRCGGWWQRARTASRFCCTTRRSIRRRSTRSSTLGSSASARSASRRMFRSFWNSWAMKKAGTKRARVCEEEAGGRGEEHGGIFEAAIRRGRAEGGSAGEYGVREGNAGCKGESAYTRDAAKEFFGKAASVAKKPFIYLSAGVSNDVYRGVGLGRQSGVNFSGVLCGRATWKDGMPIYAKQGLKALEDWLPDQGVRILRM